MKLKLGTSEFFVKRFLKASAGVTTQGNDDLTDEQISAVYEFHIWSALNHIVQALAICQHLLGYSLKEALKEMPADFERLIEERGTDALRGIDAYAKAINAQVH